MMTRSGITAQVRVWETAVIVPIWRDAAKRKEHDLFFTSWGNASLDPSDIMMPAVHGGGRGNSAGYANPDVDRLLDQAETETDMARRRAIYLQVQQMVHNDAPWVFLWLPQDVYGVSKRLVGFKPSADGKIYLSRVSVK
jgi:peptide/nickel transport system substrate-binding protein